MIVVAVSLVAKGLGYGEKLVLAYHFGTGPEVDVYLLIFGIIFSMFVVFRELIEPGALRTMEGFVGKGEEKKANVFFNSVAVGVLGLAVLLVLPGMIWPRAVIRLFAPGFAGEKLEMAIEIWRWAWPSVALLGLSALTYITLNAEKRFFVPALGDVFFKGGSLAFLLAYQVGMPLTILGMAILVGAGGKLVPHLIGLRHRVRLRLAKWKFPGRSEFAGLTLPLVLGVLFSQLSVLIDFGWGSTLGDGAIAALGYARKIVDLPIVVFPYAFGIVLFPFFTTFSRQQSQQRLLNLFGVSMRSIFGVFLFIGLALIFFSTPIVQLLLERGAFEQSATEMTVAPLKVYGVGAVFMAIETVLVLFFFGRGDTRTPVVVGILGVILNIGLTWLLVNQIAYLGIAWALVISKGLKVLVLLEIVRRQFRISWSRVLPFCGRVLVAGAVSAAVMVAFINWGSHFGGEGTVGQLLRLSVGGGLAFMLYLGTAYAIGIRARDFRLDGGVEMRDGQ